MELDVFKVSLPSRGRWLFPLGVFLLLLSGCLVVIWLGLRPSFSIPRETTLLISVSPRVFKTLPAEAREKLPSIWQRALVGNSRWPVILGGYQRETTWRYFVVAPRWVIVQEDRIREKKGVVVLLSDEALPQQGKALRYLDQADWWEGERGAALSFWADPRGLFPDGHPFIGHYKNRMVTTNIPFKSPSGEPLKNADVSIRLPETIDRRAMINGLLEEMQANPLPAWLTDLAPTEIYANYGSSTTPRSLVIGFQKEINDEQARNILGYFGYTQRKVVELDDGTLSTEGFLPKNTEKNSLFSQKDSRKWGKIQIIGKELRFGSETDLPPLTDLPICKGLKPTARLSRIPTTLYPSTPLRLGSVDNFFAVCFE